MAVSCLTFPLAPALSYYLSLLFRVRLAKTKKVTSKVAITMCWTLKCHVQIAIRGELNFEENKPRRQSNTTCPLLRGNCLNMSRGGKVFSHNPSVGDPVAPPQTPYKSVNSTNKERSVCVFNLATYIYFTLVDHVKVVSFVT